MVTGKGVDDTCLSAEPATSTSSCVNDDPPSKNPFPDDMKMPAREETTSSSYKRAASAVIARVTHKNETKSWLTSEEKAQRSNEYQRLYPNGKKSDSSAKDSPPPEPKNLQPSSTSTTTIECSVTSNAYYEEGKKLQEEERYAEAIDKYSTALECIPKTDTQLAIKVQIELAQCLHNQHSSEPMAYNKDGTDPPMIKALRAIDKNLRHQTDDEKERSIQLAISIHLAIMQRDDPSKRLGSILSSYLLLTNYINLLDNEENLKAQEIAGKC